MKKGFATFAILYTILLLFIVLLVGILNNFQNKKMILDTFKEDTINALQNDTVTDAILDQMTVISNKIVEIENRVIFLEQQLNQNINGTYTLFAVFGYLQTKYTFSNTILIGDMSNKKITVTSAIL